MKKSQILNGDIEIGNRVKYYREKEKLSQKKLADLVMVSQSTITRLEKGQSMVSVFTIIDIANVLHVSVSEILTDKSVFDEMELTNVVEKLRKCSPEQRQALIHGFDQILNAIFFK